MKQILKGVHKNRLIRRYRFNSISMQIFLTIFVFMLINISTCLYIWVRTYRESTQEKIQAINQEIVDRSHNTMDTMLTMIDNSIEGLVNNTDVIALAAIPSLEDHSRNQRIQQALISATEFNQISEAFIYIDRLGQFLASDEMLTTLEKSRYKQVQQYHEAQWHEIQGFGGDDKVKTRMEIVGEELFFMRDFPRNGKNSMLTIGFLCDLEAIYGNVIGDKLNSADFYVISNEGKILLSSDRLSVGSVYDWDRASASSVFAQRSSYSGLVYVLKYYDSGGFVSHTFIGYILPGVVLLIASSLFLSLYLVRKVYNPIQGLVALLFDMESRVPAHASVPVTEKNEYDFLEKMYLDMQNKITMMSQMIDFTRPIVRERIMRKLVLEDNGQIAPHEYSAIISFLGNIRDDLPNTAVLVLQLFDDNALEFSANAKAADIAELMVATLADNCFDHQKYQYDVFSADQATTILVLQVAAAHLDEESYAEIVRLVHTMCAESTDKLSMEILVGLSSHLSYIRDLHLLYKEANDSLEEKKYLRSVAHSLNAGDADASGRYDKWIGSFKKRIDAFLITENYDELDAMLTDYAKTWPEELKITTGEKKMGYMIFLDCLSGYLKTQTGSAKDFEDFQAGRLALEQDIYALGNDEVPSLIAVGIKELFDDTREELLEIRLKKQHKRIAKAVSYIRRHYADPTLSLTQIAESIDTNSAYLSKLFKKQMGVNFVDYINKYRVGRAKKLLRSSDLSIQQICREVGFISAQNFIKVFRKFEQCTPGQYRAAFGRDDTEL